MVYLSNAKEMYKDDSVIRNIASSIKKKLIIRSAPESLMEPEKAKEAIERIIPKEATIHNIKFVPGVLGGLHRGAEARTGYRQARL